jgi:hypothetical protein
MSDGSIGVAWYIPEAWQQLAAMPEARIEKSYQDFVCTFERARRELAAHGVRAERVVIDIKQDDRVVSPQRLRGRYQVPRGLRLYGAAGAR